MLLFNLIDEMFFTFSVVTRKIFFGKTVPTEKVSSHRSGSSERREGVVVRGVRGVRGTEMMLTPLETQPAQQSPSSAHPTAVTDLDNSDTS